MAIKTKKISKIVSADQEFLLDGKRLLIAVDSHWAKEGLISDPTIIKEALDIVDQTKKTIVEIAPEKSKELLHMEEEEKEEVQPTKQQHQQEEESEEHQEDEEDQKTNIVFFNNINMQISLLLVYLL